MRRAAAFCLLLALSGFAAAQTGMTPVDAKYLSGGAFRSPDGWFAIAAPAGWQWLEMRSFDGDADPRFPKANQNVAWVARSAKTSDNFGVMESYIPFSNAVSTAFAAKYEADARQGLAAGDSLSDFKVEHAMIAAQPSVRFSYKVTGKDGSTSFRYGYLSGKDHKVTVITTTEAAGEPRWFALAAASLRWRKAP